MEELANKHSVKIGLEGSVVVLEYEKTATLEAARMLDEILVKRFDASPGSKWALLVVIDANNPPPDNQTRDAISKAMKGHGGRVSALAYVVLGTGFRAGSIRAALVTLNLLSQSEYPKKVFKQTDDAVEWIGATAPHVLPALQLPQTKLAVAQFRS